MESDVERIKARLNIQDVVGQYIDLKRAGKNLTARCPFHKERTPSFYVSPERGTYMCFGCGEKGDVFSFVQKMDGIDFPTALKQLADKAGVTLEKRFVKPQAQKDKEERLREVCEEAVRFYEGELTKRADVKEYIRARGVEDETAHTWRLGYAPALWDSLSKHLVAKGFSKEDIVESGFALHSQKRAGEIFDRFRGRIIFPIFDAGGQPIAVSGRFFEEVKGGALPDGRQAAKYVNSPETALFKKSRVLYGFDRARTFIRKADCILLVEGQFDLILSHQSGLPFCVALSGTALTPEHLSLLGKLSKRLVLALDADEAGIRAGLKSTQMALSSGFEVKIPALPQGKDPADLSRENPELLKAAVRTSKTAIEFFLDALRPGARDEHAYKKSVELYILPLVASVESHIEREHFVTIVAKYLSVSPEAVRAEVYKRLSSKRHESEFIEHGALVPQESPLSPMEKKIVMLVSYFEQGSPVYIKLLDLVGELRILELKESSSSELEAYRFRFEAELGEHTTPDLIAQDMLEDIDRQISKERFKMKFL